VTSTRVPLRAYPPRGWVQNGRLAAAVQNGRLVAAVQNGRLVAAIGGIDL
jgi:hypothetical protein